VTSVRKKRWRGMWLCSGRWAKNAYEKGPSVKESRPNHLEVKPPPTPRVIHAGVKKIEGSSTRDCLFTCRRKKQAVSALTRSTVGEKEGHMRELVL